MAERLEDRGARIRWRRIERKLPSRAWKLLRTAALQPGLPAEYPPTEIEQAGVDAAVCAHSYLAPHFRALSPRIPRIVDFQDLEWRHLEDIRAQAGGARSAYLAVQVPLIRRFERRVVARSSLSLFASSWELDWAEGSAAPGTTMHVPSVLPRATDAGHQGIQGGRRPGDGSLLYFGTLDFPPNLNALERFLKRDWPAIRASVPSAKLAIAGRVSEQGLGRLAGYPDVRILGFVESLEAAISAVDAVVMPIEGEAGTSLRALRLALSGVAVIGSPAAFRGLPFEMGEIARTPEEWAEAVRRVAQADRVAAEVVNRARDGARRLQDDPAPWDELMDRIDALVRRG